jgi:hypothetical protein
MMLCIMKVSNSIHGTEVSYSDRGSPYFYILSRCDGIFRYNK